MWLRRETVFLFLSQHIFFQKNDLQEFIFYEAEFPSISIVHVVIENNSITKILSI
jgi:hypothetical protein